MEAMLYLQVFNNTDKGVGMINSSRPTSPTPSRLKRGQDSGSVKQQAAAKKIQ